MIWFVISIILLLFSAAVTGVALSNNVKGAGIGLTLASRLDEEKEGDD